MSFAQSLLNQLMNQSYGEYALKMLTHKLALTCALTRKHTQSCMG